MDIINIEHHRVCTRSRSRSPGGASHKSAQAAFLRMFGFVMEEQEIEIQPESILEHDTCVDIAVALQHSSYQDHPMAKHLLEHPSRDPTFTKEEFESYQIAIGEILDKLLTMEDPQQVTPLKEELAKLRKQGCQCPLHLQLDAMPSESIPADSIFNLFETPLTLTNYWGVKVMTIIFDLVSQASGLQMDIEEISSGSPIAVSYVVTSRLRTRTSPRRSSQTTTHVFEGYPDTAIFTRRRGRIRKIVRGLGEVQSKPGVRRWQDSMAQIGIYSLGNMDRYGLSRMVNVVLTKDKGALVLAMSHENGDEWKYKFVESMVPYDLKDAVDIQRFARVLVSALKWANQETQRS